MRRLLAASIVVTIASELAFTFYVSAYGFSNLVGHYLKIVSFFLIYRALIELGLRKPYDLLFRDLKRREEVLRESEQQYRALFEQAADPIVLTDTEDGALVEFNDRAHENLGYTREEFQSLSLADLDAMGSCEGLTGHIERIYRVGGDTFETKMKAKGGKVRDILVSAITIRMRGKSYISSILRDVTESKRLEEQLRQSQKMEAVGHLAGGIAHQFNNLLQAILGYAELIQPGMSPGNRDHSDVEQIKRTGERAAALTQQLLCFGRRQILRMTVVDLNELVLGHLEMLREKLGEGLDIEFVAGRNLAVVRTDSGLIGHVLVHLCENAREAMPSGGKVTIETKNVVLGEDFCDFHHGAKPGSYVCFSVSDTGIGMGPDVLERVFEPFYTTKEVGQGTGLGLSMVYGIVKQHDGYTDIVSEPGRGSTFYVYVPIADTPVATGAKKTAQAAL